MKLNPFCHLRKRPLLAWFKSRKWPLACSQQKVPLSAQPLLAYQKCCGIAPMSALTACIAVFKIMNSSKNGPVVRPTLFHEVSTPNERLNGKKRLFRKAKIDSVRAVLARSCHYASCAPR